MYLLLYIYESSQIVEMDVTLMSHLKDTKICMVFLSVMCCKLTCECVSRILFIFTLTTKIIITNILIFVEVGEDKIQGTPTIAYWLSVLVL